MLRNVQKRMYSRCRYEDVIVGPRATTLLTTFFGLGMTLSWCQELYVHQEKLRQEQEKRDKERHAELRKLFLESKR
jgi:hypothetical protein